MYVYRYSLDNGKFVHKITANIYKKANSYEFYSRVYKCSRPIRATAYIFGRLTESKIKCKKIILARKLNKIIEKENRLAEKERETRWFINRCLEDIYD